MTKFPVWATVKDAYDYLLRDADKLIRANWQLVAVCFGLLLVLRFLVSLMRLNASQVGSAAVIFLPFILILVVIYSYYMAAYMAAVARRILGLAMPEKAWVPFHNPDAVHIFAINWGIGVLALLYILGVSFVLIVFGAIVPSIRSGIYTVGGAVAFVGGIYLLLRMSWLVVPLAVSDESEVIRKSWALDGGHTGQIFLISLLLYILPVIAMVIFSVLFGVIFGLAGVGGSSANPGLALIAGIISAVAYFVIYTLLARAQVHCYQLCHAEAGVNPQPAETQS